MNNAVRSLRTTYVYARSSARDIATNIYRVYSAALNLVRVSPAHGAHYLNFNHNFAGARHAYAKCVLKGKGRRRQRDDERKRARERERDTDTSIYICISTTRRLKPTRSARATQLRQPGFCLPFAGGKRGGVERLRQG